MERLSNGAKMMFSFQIKHSRLGILLIISLCVCIFFWIGRVLFQYDAQQTKFSGSIIGQYMGGDNLRFIIKNPNNLKESIDIELPMFQQKEDHVSSPVLTQEGLYFIASKWYTEQEPRIMFLTQEGVKEVSITWPSTILQLYVHRLYVYDDKFYLTFRSKNYNTPDKIYSVPKNGGIAKEVYSNLNLHGFGDPTAQMDGIPVQYKDGIICIRWGTSTVIFVNDEREDVLFPLPIGTATLLKGWYEEDKSLMLWSDEPNYSVVVDLHGDVLEIYSAWLLSTNCWDIYGNADNGILLESTSTKDYPYYFPGIDKTFFFRKENINHFDSGIYDTRTGNMIPFYWKNQIFPRGWSKVDYDKVFFEKLAKAAVSFGKNMR